MRRAITALLLGILSAAAAIGIASAAADSPNAVIEDSMVVLTEKLDGRKAELAADRKSLYALIDEMLLPRFDRKFAAQLVLARHWRSASAAQRERFIEAFYQALLRRYADGILEFDPNKITVMPFRGDASKPRTKVRSTVALDDGSKVAVDYDLVKRKSGWLVYNVVIEGVSYVTNFRAELDAEIRDTSLDAVIARLEKEAGMPANE
ncbi:MAG: ABC transporter substrate-binding protein [Gammaproteobacteria bacterium]|nr:ABC transporter substrate-binding protein [Gammaproteobacteria bacterium]